MAKQELGTKRTCGNCGARFYDLNRDPIICPKCETVFVLAPVARAKPEKAAPVKAKAKEKEDDDEDELESAELVPLEDADDEGGSTGAVKAAGLDDDDDDDDDDDEETVDIDLDIDVDDDDSEDDDTFLEDDDDDNDAIIVVPSSGKNDDN